MVFSKKKKSETFHFGKLDIIVTIIVLIVFYWALFFDSFIPLTDSNGSVMLHHYTGEPLVKINIQVIIAPIILCYEILLIRLEGKKRGRYIPWSFYYCILKYIIYLKYLEGKHLTKEYFDNKKKLNRI